VLDALERGAIGNMPAPNFTRYFAEVQRLWETGARDEAENLFAIGLPFALWAMQSIDHSVIAAKTELHRRGIIASPRLRQPATPLDDIGRRQLSRYLDRQLSKFE
jgi:dihydrodipicolinate synthase/N-acetylneuraminate lyase